MSVAARRAMRTRHRPRCMLGMDAAARHPGPDSRSALRVECGTSARSARRRRTAGDWRWRGRRPWRARWSRRAAGQGCQVHRVGIGVPELVGPGGEIESRAVLPWQSAWSPQGVRCVRRRDHRLYCRAAALAEARLGAARGSPTFLYVGVGTGISSTLFIDGRPYLGAHGHAIAFASGATCAAKARDGRTVIAALESRASGPGLVSRAKSWAIAPSAGGSVPRGAQAIRYRARSGRRRGH